jgi:hypothetical protein
MYNKIYKKFFSQSHISISFFGTLLGVVTSVILFLYSTKNNQELVIAKFSIFLLIFFGTSIICMVGNDLEILAKTKMINKKIIIIDNRVFKLIISLLLNVLLFKIYNHYKNIFVIEISTYDLLIIHIAIFINNINKTFQSYIQSSSKLFANSLIDLSRYSGYFFFLITWILNLVNELSVIFIFGEILAILSLFFYFILNFSNIYFVKDNSKFDTRYIFQSISQFSYQGLFKIDILTLSIIGNARLVIMYAILSNVIEGIVNFITTFHPSMNNFIIKNKQNIIKKQDINNYFSINKIADLLIILILPAYLIFNYLIFFKMPEISFFLIVCILAISIFISKKLFLFYFIFSLYEKPFTQLFFSIFFLSTNLILNIIFYKNIGIIGIALATSFSYLLFNTIIIRELKNKKFKLN